MLSDRWPLFGLRLETPRLVLRLPYDEEVAVAAELAGRGVHAPDERPFLTPWTEGTSVERGRRTLQLHWAKLAEWTPTDWWLGLAVFAAGDEASGPRGIVTLGARDFAVAREVRTSSWLGIEHHGRGIGTEARTALLALAFDHLGAVDALTEVFTDNAASQGVSRRLGYEPDGISRDARGDEVLVSDRLRLTRQRWRELRAGRPDVHVSGLEPCRDLFGV